jgi:hypothetical protein
MLPRTRSLSHFPAIAACVLAKRARVRPIVVMDNVHTVMAGTIQKIAAFPILKEDSPLRHQNQPPDGSRPLMRRYVTKLP